MKKSAKIIGTALAVLLMGTVAGCSNEETEKEVKKATEEVAKKAKSDEELAKELGKAVKPVFAQITEDKLTDDEKKIVKILKNATGVNLHGDDLFIIVPKKGENKVRFITEVHDKDKVIKVYLKKAGAKEEGQDFMLGRVKDLKKEKYEVWFMDAETKEPIQLEDLEKEVKKDTKEKAEATTVETEKEGAKGSVEKKAEEESSETKEDKK